MVYETVRDRQQLVPGSIVWGYAFRRPDRRSDTQMRLFQKPVQGKIASVKRDTPVSFDGNTPRYFVPLKKNSDTECSWSKVIDIDSRDYADTEEEAIEAYNKKIEWAIHNVKEELKELEEMKIGRL